MSVLFYEEFSKTRKDTTVAKQFLRFATRMGANINEAVYGNSKADFIAKLKRTNLIDYNFEELISLAEEIKRMLVASLKTAKEKK